MDQRAAPEQVYGRRQVWPRQGHVGGYRVIQVTRNGKVSFEIVLNRRAVVVVCDHKEDAIDSAQIMVAQDAAPAVTVKPTEVGRLRRSPAGAGRGPGGKSKI